MTEYQKNPFIVGDWIKNDADFIGRKDLIQKYLPLQRQFNWLIGARRMGKTSLLRYLQRQYRKQDRMIPLFWDVSGANSVYDLKLSFIDALEPAEFEFSRLEIEFDLDHFERESLYWDLRCLIRQCRKKSVHVVLLVDESEALFRVAVQDEQFLHQFRAILLNQPMLSVILASNHGLASYDKLSTTHFLAPFLQAFSPPDYITPWDEDEARALIRRCTGDVAEQDKIIEFAGCLPFLVQMICFYFFDQGNLKATIETIRQNNVLDLFFRDDFQYFDQVDYQILANLIHLEPSYIEAIAPKLNISINHIQKRLNTLSWLGFAKQNSDQKFALNNYFLRTWIAENISEQPPSVQSPKYGVESSEKLKIFFTEEFQKICTSKNGDITEVHQLNNALDPHRYIISDFGNIQSLKKLGQKLFSDLFPTQDSLDLFSKFYATEKNSDLVFSSEIEELIRFPFEILHNGDSFVSLRKAIYRSLVDGKVTDVYHFPTDDPINILLIASDTPPDIPFVDNEIILLKNRFHKIAREHGLSLKISTLLSHESDFGSVMRSLRSNHFHIIHFAGHCSPDPASLKTHIFLWEKQCKSGRAQAVTANDIFSEISAPPLFFYLNGCNSAGNNATSLSFCGFAPAFLKAGGQAFLGNMSVTDDRASAEFSMDFYWNLFANQFSYSKALQQTRLKWAAQARFLESGHLFWMLPSLWQNF
ncbi:MAG: CHAT domain-containing protein [Candidatus Zhuqueibacterota bacterium]